MSIKIVPEDTDDIRLGIAWIIVLLWFICIMVTTDFVASRIYEHKQIELLTKERP